MFLYGAEKELTYRFKVDQIFVDLFIKLYFLLNFL